MFKTVEANEAEIMSTWMKAAADIQREFESGG